MLKLQKFKFPTNTFANCSEYSRYSFIDALNFVRCTFYVGLKKFQKGYRKRIALASEAIVYIE